MKLNTIINGDCLQGLKDLPGDSVNCVVTSPPYFGLRDYGMDGQIGLEETPEHFIEKMVNVFREVKRVLKKDGTVWLNIGDSYAGGGNYRGVNSEATLSAKQRSNGGARGVSQLLGAKNTPNCKPKDLIGIPWMLAFALRADGWYLRQDIIWHKPNPMPESVTDRCTKSHEYIFLLSKSQRYYYDAKAIQKPLSDTSIQRLSQDVESQEGSDRVPGKTNGKMKAVGQYAGGKNHPGNDFFKTRNDDGQEWTSDGFANKRSVWTVTTKPFSEAHFATFPEDLIVDCIKAGCPIDGLVLDPFMGAGTTALVSRKLNRNFIGFELNPEYIKIAEKRLYNELGMFQ